MTHRPPRRGFTLLMAVGVLTIVSAAIAMLAATASTRIRQVHDQNRAAQIDQLLLAGLSEAVEHLKSTPPSAGQSWKIDLPPTLADQNAELATQVLSMMDSSHAAIMIRARIENRSSSQAAFFVRQNEQWRLESVRLDAN